MTETTKMFKVLIDGKSYNGGDFEYSLPRKRGRGWQPGEWTPAVDSVRCGSTGYHLTTKPYEWFKWGATIYEAEGDGVSHADGDKIAFERARLLRPVKEAEWVTRTKILVGDINNLNWLSPDGNPKPEWKVFFTRLDATDAARTAVHGAGCWDAKKTAARDAAWGAAKEVKREVVWAAARNLAWDAAWNPITNNNGNYSLDAAGNAARDAQLITWVDGICSDLQIDEKHRAHSRARWEVWQKGYGLLCDVNGELYVYEQLS